MKHLLLFIDELENATVTKRDKMLSLIPTYNIVVLAPDDEANKLANIYVSEGIIPARYRTDGIHIAIAAINHLDMIISMNFQHIVKRKTKLAVGKINALNNYPAIEIYSPMEVVKNEDAGHH
jgi:hypothetical protein